MGWADCSYFMTALESSADCVKVVDTDGCLRFMN